MGGSGTELVPVTTVLSGARASRIKILSNNWYRCLFSCLGLPPDKSVCARERQPSDVSRLEPEETGIVCQGDS